MDKETLVERGASILTVSSLLELIFAGMLATAAMTLVAESAFRILQRPYHIIRILANMMLFKDGTSVIAKAPVNIQLAAGFLHYGIGVLFSFVFYLIAPLQGWTLIQALLYGVSIGLIGISGWGVFFTLHPGPPPVSLKEYLPIVWLGHIVLAAVLFYIAPPAPAQASKTEIPLCYKAKP